MGVPYSVTYTTTGAKTPVITDYTQTPFNASAAVILVGAGTATYGLEYTLDDVNDASVTPVWFPDANLPAGTAASGTTNFMFPVQAVRINIAAISGAVRFVFLQGTQQS